MKDVRNIAGDVAGDIVSLLTGSKITKLPLPKRLAKLPANKAKELKSHVLT